MGMNHVTIAIIAITVALASILMMTSITHRSNGITLSDLYRVNAYASVAIVDGLDGKEPCLLGVGEEFLNISNALKDQIMHVRYLADSTGMYNEYHATTISGAEAYKLITAITRGYSTTTLSKPHVDTLYRLGDEHGYISCIIEHDGRYYDVRINPLESFLSDIERYGIPEDMGYITNRVTIKALDDGRFSIVALDKSEQEVFYPFNSLLLLTNELDSKVRIRVTAHTSDGWDEHPYYYVIPPKGTKPIVLRGWAADAYTYTVEQYNLHGTVKIRSYSSCMSEEDVRYGYALANFNVRLPSYLPEGYEYRCGIHIMNNYLMIYYSKDITSGQHISMQEALARGMLVISAYRVLSYERGYWDASTDVKSADGKDAITMEIDGRQAVAYREVDVDYDLWEKYYYNVLNLYDHESRVIYSFKSRLLSLDDLVDIARSLR